MNVWCLNVSMAIFCLVDIQRGGCHGRFWFGFGFVSET